MGKRGHAPLICGLSGGCVSVNASPYSEVFGIPVAALGGFMYLLARGDPLWLGLSRGPRPASLVALIGFIIALAGSLFSLYLTAIEAFVLRAYCMWCLISWGLVTAITVIWAKAVTRASGEVSRG